MHFNMKFKFLLTLGFWLSTICCTPSFAAESADITGPPSPSKDNSQMAETTADSAPLVIFNRTITVFRSHYFGFAPADRAARAKQEILRVLDKGGNGKVSYASTPQGRVVLLSGEFVFSIFPKDVDQIISETIDDAARNAVRELTLVVSETREARDVTSMSRAAGKSMLATFFLVLLGWILHHIRLWVSAIILPRVQEKTSQLRIGGEVILNGELVLKAVTMIFSICYWIMIALLINEWLGFVLASFPYTRPWGDQLNQFLIDMVLRIANGIVTTIPDLFIAFIIFMIAKGIIHLLRSFFDRVEDGHISLVWLDRDTVRPTRRLVSAAIWLFALAMAYPYLPGAQTQAFKGLSVLVGLMISLGASSLIGQAASGLIIMFTRTVKAGEYVSISDKEGTVVEVTLFNTHIRTGLGEELTLPNSLILNSITKNYSRVVHGKGYILDTSVTIGYDTPWRQINAMLLEAANRTSGVLSDPPPRVFQTSLSDYYPEYRLVCQAIHSTAQSRAEALTLLHTNIQDVFNEYGVQIMSPHYMNDPAEPKIVPKEEWYAAPAKPPNKN